MAFFNFAKHRLLAIDTERREEGEEDGRKEKWHGKITGAQTKLLDMCRISSMMKHSSLHTTFRCFSNTNTDSHNKTTLINQDSQAISSLFIKSDMAVYTALFVKKTDSKNALKRQHFHGIHLLCS